MHHNDANMFSTKSFFNDPLSQSITEQLSVAVFMIDSENNIRFCNQSAATLFSLSQKKLLGHSFFDNLILHTFPLSLLEELWICGRGFSDNDVEMEFVDGRHIMTEVVAEQAIIDDQKYCILEIRQNDNLRKISKENTQKHHISASRHLIRGLAHEIKNPLGGIRGAAQLLGRSLVSDELKEYTQMIIEQSDRLRDLVDRLLGPNTPPKQELYNIHVIVDRVYNLAKMDKPEAIKIHRDYDPSLPHVVCDPNQIEQGLLNVVRNGIQALAGFINENTDTNYQPLLVLKTRYAGSKVMHNTRYRKVLLISVIDNGPGISDELKDTIFYPLVTTKDDGNGLGLSISQTLISQHQGQIEVESGFGKTEFNIYLPVI